MKTFEAIITKFYGEDLTIVDEQKPKVRNGFVNLIGIEIPKK